MTDLKPCPFCGGTDVGFARRDGVIRMPGEEEYVIVYCHNEECHGCTGLCENEEGATQVWNRRPLDSDTRNRVLEEAAKKLDWMVSVSPTYAVTAKAQLRAAVDAIRSLKLGDRT